MEWEVKPFGTPFDGSGIESGTFHDSGVPDIGPGSYAVLDELVTGLDFDPTHHWRLRIASHNPYFPHTPWFSPPGNGATEIDLRTADAAEGTLQLLLME